MKKGTRRHRRRDKNHAEIQDEMVKRGIACIDHSKENVGYDILTVYHTNDASIRYVEVKNPEKINKSDRGAIENYVKYLTEDERKMRDFCKKNGVPYLIVTSYDEFTRQL